MSNSIRTFRFALILSGFTALAASQASAQFTKGKRPPTNGSTSGLPNGSNTDPVSPVHGDVGDLLTLSGNFAGLDATYDPIDVFATNNEVEDEQFFFGRCLSLTPASVEVELTGANPFAKPDQVQLIFGTGTEFAVPPLDNFMTYPEKVWVWHATSASPVHVSTNNFTANKQFVNQPCSAPPTVIKQPFVLESDGCLRAQLPGFGAQMNDKFRSKVTFDVLTTSTSTVVTYSIDTGWSGSLALAMPWFWAESYIEAPLAGAVFFGSIPCIVDYDPATGMIEICPQAGFTIVGVGTLSSVCIELDPAKHTLFSARRGDIDNFFYSTGQFEDVPMPSLDFSWAWPGSSGFRPYDNDGLGCNRNLADSVDGININGTGSLGFAIPDGEIRSAVFELHMSGVGCETYTDAIFIGWDGDLAAQQFQWLSHQKKLQALSYQWLPGDDAVLCFDLGMLPAEDGSIANILHTLAGRDQVDFLIADDTTVDYVTVSVLRANP